MTIIDSALAETIDAYRTCEFVTLGRDGAPLTWPTAAYRNENGTLLVTTCLGYAQKALNVRRDGRVALLFSDPTGSGLTDPPQVFVSGTAVCPDEIMAGPDGAEEYWRTLFRRQPDSRKYVVPPARWLMDWYYLRLLITVTPEQIVTRPPLARIVEAAPGPEQAMSAAPDGLPGVGLVAGFPSGVLGYRDASGAPVLFRTRAEATPDGFVVEPAADRDPLPGAASLLVHRHDDRLGGLSNALVRGELKADGDRWLLVPQRVVEPGASGRPADVLRTLRAVRKSTDRYLERRGLARPKVQWDRFRELAAAERRNP